jgi:8-oxo-dGTP pyrophosphatase MutT (NUDIX family)
MNRVEIRVRAAAITDDGKLVVIRRERSGRLGYRVFPGGGMQPTDRDEVSALVRELAEEIAAVVTVGRPVYSIDSTSESNEPRRDIFFVCRLHSYSTSGGRGPEWEDLDPDNRYFVESIEMDEASLRSADLVPHEFVDILIAAGDPFDLPSIDR